MMEQSENANLKEKIYLDYAATTPLDKRVLEAMLPFLKEKFGNPSSPHSFGREAFEAIERAREKAADFLNCFSSEIIFTSSATEANNLALFGTVRVLKERVKKPHIITTQIEHPSILNPCKELEKQGVEVSFVKPEKTGVVNPPSIQKELKRNTVLVSVMYANNEIGTIQPIVEIGKTIQSFKKKNFSVFPFFHSDAVQAANYLECDVQKLKVDMLTLSGHKVYGPKGIGILYLKQGVKLSPLMYGGGQERKLKPGTENVASIVGIAEALSITKELRQGEAQRIKKLRDLLLKKILQELPQVQLNGSPTERLPNNINLAIPEVEGEKLAALLDEKGIAVSTGSACHTKSLEPSHVILALGKSRQEALSCLRITLGRKTNLAEIERTAEELIKIIKRLS
jgi:cysteine desulfurase